MIIVEIQHKGWDWDAVKSESWNEISEEFLPVALSWVRKYHSVLDIGTGKGRHAFFFAKNGFKASAIDLSESSITYVKEQIKEKGLDNIDARVEDMAELSYENQSFDCVICFHTIYHTSYDGVVKALREINRVLKDKGEAFISFNTKDNPHYVKEKTVDGYTMIATEGHEAGIPHCYVDENDLFGLLQDFEILSMNKEINYVRKGKGTHGVRFYVHVAKK